MIANEKRVPSGCLEKHGFPHPRADSHNSDLQTVHVAFFDNRKNPDVSSMQQAAKLVNSSSRTPVEFHALLSQRRQVPGLSVHPIQLPPLAQCLYAYLAESSHGPGPQYMYKPFVPWLLPRRVKRVVLLDTDVAMLSGSHELWSSFDHFNGALVGLANEQNDLYKPMVGKNGGLQLLDLDGIRSSHDYLSIMDRFNVDGYRIGFLGDQTFYTVLAHLHPHLVYTVGCEWNRQLNTHFGAGIERFNRCDRGCSLLHANQGPVKCIVKHLQVHGNGRVPCVAKFRRQRPSLSPHGQWNAQALPGRTAELLWVLLPHELWRVRGERPSRLEQAGYTRGDAALSVRRAHHEHAVAVKGRSPRRTWR
jgi:hypothetical protein